MRKRSSPSGNGVGRPFVDQLRNELKRGVVMHTIKRFLHDESAATAIEYGLIAAGISVVIITVVNGVGTKGEGYLHVD